MVVQLVSLFFPQKLVSLFNDGSIAFVCISLTIRVSCFHILYLYFSNCESCLGELFNDPNFALLFFELFSLSWWLWVVYPQGEDQWLGYILWPFLVCFLGKLMSPCIGCHDLYMDLGVYLLKISMNDCHAEDSVEEGNVVITLWGLPPQCWSSQIVFKFFWTFVLSQTHHACFTSFIYILCPLS